MNSCGIYLQAIQQEMLQIAILDMSLIENYCDNS